MFAIYKANQTNSSKIVMGKKVHCEYKVLELKTTKFNQLSPLKKLMGNKF